MSEKSRALALSAQLERLLAGEPVEECTRDEGFAKELNVARHLGQMVARLPAVPVELERRVGALICSQPVRGQRRGARRAGWKRWQPALWSALATAIVLVAIWFLLPGLGPTDGRSVWAEMRAVLLGQTRIEVTPTLARAAEPVREPLRDLVAAELLIGRAPSLPKTLPDPYVLQEVTAISYPDLPAWISQPLCVELCYGEPGEPCTLRLRQYRLLFRDFGGISGVKVAGNAVRDVEQVELQGTTGMLFTLASERGEGQSTQTVVWERDGLLLELESDQIGPEQLLEIARSTR